VSTPPRVLFRKLQSMNSRFAKIGLIVVLLVVIGGGYLFWRIKTPPTVGENFKTLPAEEQQRRREDARKLEDQVQEVIRKKKGGDKSPFRLTASEAQLNTLLQDRINTEKFPIHDLRAGLEDGQLTLQGTVPYKGTDVQATLSGKVSAEDGKVAYKVESLLLGGLFQAPDKWKRKVEKQVTPQINKALEHENINITRAAVEDKQLILEGVPR
jgi:hypothetical protein